VAQLFTVSRFGAGVSKKHKQFSFSQKATDACGILPKEGSRVSGRRAFRTFANNLAVNANVLTDHPQSI
jgi:hypothetical protein